jgi:hypothetical protein
MTTTVRIMIKLARPTRPALVSGFLATVLA